MKSFKKVATVVNNNQRGWTNIVETAANVTLELGTELYVKEEKEVVDVVLELIEKDPHQFSSRPCQTCQTVSNMIGKPWGCIAKEKTVRQSAR